MITLPELAHYSTDFPDPLQALVEPNGLLAFGGDLSVKRLTSAYAKGIFPWFSADEPILWWSPDPRGVLPLDELYISKTTKKWLKHSTHTITINHAFVDVIQACATIPRGPILTEDGTIQHARLQIGDSLIMLNQADETYAAMQMQMHLYVANVDRSFASAISKGATSIMKPMLRPHGDKMAGFCDPMDNIWWVAQAA